MNRKGHDMQRMWRQMFAAAAGVLVVAGLAAAQSPPPNPLPPVHAYAPASGPGYGPAVRPASAGYNTPVVPPGSGLAGLPAQVHNAPPIYYAQYGPGGANGCGNIKSDLGFMFGSCKSFFDPCGPLPCNGGGHGHGKFGTHRFGRGGLGDCPRHPYAAPYGTGYNGCVYDSYLNH
jgi:hypothetical protein